MTIEGNVSIVETLESNRRATCPTCNNVVDLDSAVKDCDHLFAVQNVDDNGTKKLRWSFYK